jgi:predicted MFS family arabinose efflux permease
VLLLVSFGVLWAGGATLVGLALGVVVLDFAVQGAQVSNFARIYALSSDAHSRVNSAFMVAYFLGGAGGSVLGTWAWGFAKWNGVCAAGAALALAAIVTHLLARTPVPPAGGAA